MITLVFVIFFLNKGILAAEIDLFHCLIHNSGVADFIFVELFDNLVDRVTLGECQRDRFAGCRRDFEGAEHFFNAHRGGDIINAGQVVIVFKLHHFRDHAAEVTVFDKVIVLQNFQNGFGVGVRRDIDRDNRFAVPVNCQNVVDTADCINRKKDCRNDADKHHNPSRFIFKEKRFNCVPVELYGPLFGNHGTARIWRSFFGKRFFLGLFDFIAFFDDFRKARKCAGFRLRMRVFLTGGRRVLLRLWRKVSRVGRRCAFL